MEDSICEADAGRLVWIVDGKLDYKNNDHDSDNPLIRIRNASTKCQQNGQSPKIINLKCKYKSHRAPHHALSRPHPHTVLQSGMHITQVFQSETEL
jgi:hypothetical protein